MKSGFNIVRKKGFRITFDNGFTVLVQFGPGDYCDNYNMAIGQDEEKAGSQGSSNAECAIWKPDENLITLPNQSIKVSDRSTPKEVLDLLNWAATQES